MSQRLLSALTSSASSCCWKTKALTSHAISQRIARVFRHPRHRVVVPTITLGFAFGLVDGGQARSLLSKKVAMCEGAVVVKSSTNDVNNNTAATATINAATQVKDLYHQVPMWRLLLRCMRHCIVFLPIATIFYPCYFLRNIFPGLYNGWWRLFLYALSHSGPTAIKGCQWMSTRRDLFPKELCERLSQLQQGVVHHNWEHTEEVMKQAFGDGWQDTLKLTKTPVGSGCIAQVYCGTLYTPEGPRDVAVKVIHPSVMTEIMLDIAIMDRVTVAIESAIPTSKFIGMSASVEEFGKIMFQQVDLVHEGHSLERLATNFASWKNVVIPRPIPGFVRQGVLVEEFIPCLPILEVCEGNPELSHRMAKIGFDLFMKMIFQDNFVHSDLHPGNIKVLRENDPKDLGRVVLLDAGITCELTPRDRKNFLDLFDCVARGNGKGAADLLIDCASFQECTDRQGFENEIIAIVSKFHNSKAEQRQRAGEILLNVLNLACHYRVRIESQYTSIIVGIMVLEGLGRTLDPSIDLIKAAAPVIVKEKMRDWYKSFR